MPSPPSTRDRILFSATELFSEKGFMATSVADILKSASANSGSLYHFFPTKQDVLTGVLDAYRDGIEPMLLDPAWGGVDDPIERVFALLGVYRRNLVESEFLYGCPIGSLALELHEPDPAVRERLAVNFDGWVRHVAACYAAAADRLPEGTDPRKLAVFTLTIMEGAVMQARTYRSAESFDACVDLLRDYLDRLQAVRSAEEGKP